jgi:hypothetical protein
MSPPPLGSKNKPSKKPAWSRQQAGHSTLKMEAICSTETSVHFYRITRPCITEDITLQLLLLLLYIYNNCFSSYCIMAVKVAPIKSLLSKWYLLPSVCLRVYMVVLFVHLLVIVLTLAFELSSCQKWIIISYYYYYYYNCCCCYINYPVLYFIYKFIVVVFYSC